MENKNKKDEETCIVMEVGYYSDEWKVDPSIIPINESVDDDDDLKPIK